MSSLFIPNREIERKKKYFKKVNLSKRGDLLLKEEMLTVLNDRVSLEIAIIVTLNEKYMFDLFSVQNDQYSTYL